MFVYIKLKLSIHYPST